MAALYLNKYCGAGKISQLSELKETKGGKVVNFSLAINYKTRDGYKADFINCLAWGQTAENIAKYFKKGDHIFIEGHITNVPYQNGDVKLQIMAVQVGAFQFVDSKAKPSDAPQQTQPQPQQIQQEERDPFAPNYDEIFF